ncbi:MAG: hypothetical protein ACP5VE_10620 [Chthonomonadales bacterium]
MIRFFRRLRALPNLLVAYAVLRADVEEALADGTIRAAFERFRTDPQVALIFPRISAEWRALEKAVNDLK